MKKHQCVCVPVIGDSEDMSCCLLFVKSAVTLGLSLLLLHVLVLAKFQDFENSAVAQLPFSVR